MDIKDSYLHGTVGVVKSISVAADKLTYNLADVNNTAKTITLPLVTQTANGLMSKEDKTKLDLSTGMTQAIPYIVGPDTDTTAGTWTGSYAGITAYTEGLTIIYVPAVSGASTTTLNINNLGAKTCCYTGTAKLTTHYAVGTPILFTYSGGAWRRADYYLNTYASAYCNTAAATSAKTASCYNYTLKANSYIHILIQYSNTVAGAITLTINNTGAKPIYINGTASSASNYTLPAGTYIVYYDGTNFYFRTDGILPGTIEKAQLSNLVTCTAGSGDTYRPIVVYNNNTGKIHHNTTITANYNTGDLKATSFTGTFFTASRATPSTASNIKSNTLGWFNVLNSSGYAGDNTGFPTVSNANGILWLGSHFNDIDSTKVGYGHLLGFSSNGKVYHRSINNGSFPTTANGGSWKEIAYTNSNITGNAATADKVNNKLILKINSGSTEGTSLYTYDGSSAKTIDIKSGSGIELYNTDAGSFTIYNSGVRSVDTGTVNGTISVNTNGTSAHVAVKGLGSAAYTSSDAYVQNLGISSTESTRMDLNTLNTNAFKHDHRWDNAPTGVNIASVANLAFLNDWKSQLLFSHGTLKVFFRDYNGIKASWSSWKLLAFTDSNITGNAASADKLKNSRKLWGLDFDGTADVKGTITIGGETSNKAIIFPGSEYFDGSGNFYLNGTNDVTNSFNIFKTNTDGTKTYLFNLSESKRAEFYGTVIAPTFQGNIDGSYVNVLTGYTKATAIDSIATTDSLNTALGKLEFKTDFIYNDLFGTDNDTVINKWHEIVDFIDSVAENTDITDEFVTRKTELNVTGKKTFIHGDGTYFRNGNNGVRLIGRDGYGYLLLGLIAGDGTKTHKGMITGIYAETLSELEIRSVSSTFKGVVKATKVQVEQTTSPSLVVVKNNNGTISLQTDSNRGIYDHTSSTWLIASTLAKNTYLNVGNVGVGIASPTQKLHVSGNVLATSFITSGGVSSLFVKGDGSLDSTTYATTNSLSNYLPLEGGTLTGALTISTENWGNLLILNRVNNGSNWGPSILFNYDGVNKGTLSMADNELYVGDNGINKYKVWHTGNDGAGSGLAADVLAGTLISAKSTNTCYYNLTLKWYNNINNVDGYAGDNTGFPVSNNANGLLWLGVHNSYGGQLGISSDHRIYYRFVNYGSFPTDTNGASWKKLAFTSEVPKFAGGRNYVLSKSVTMNTTLLPWYLKIELNTYAVPKHIVIKGSYNNCRDEIIIEPSGFSLGYIYRNNNLNSGHVSDVWFEGFRSTTTNKWTFWLKLNAIQDSTTSHTSPSSSATYTVYLSDNTWGLDVTATTTEPSNPNWTYVKDTNLVINKANLLGNASTATEANKLKSSVVINSKEFSLSNSKWTNTGYTFANLASGTYAVQVTSETNLVASGIMSVYKNLSDTAGDEIPLHVYSTAGWRPYLRTYANKLLISSNDATTTSRTVTIKIALIL